MPSVVFFLALVQRAGGTVQLAGLLTILGSAVLLAVVLIEGVFTLDLAQAAVNGHQVTSLTSFDIMTVFTHIYPIAPAPLIFLAFRTCSPRLTSPPTSLWLSGRGAGDCL